MNRELSDVAGQRARVSGPSFPEAFRFWLKLGFISFGGSTGQIAIMQTELVEKKTWISQSRFLMRLTSACCFPGRRRSSCLTNADGNERIVLFGDYDVD